MKVLVHQFDGVSTLDALPLAAGLLVSAAKRDARVRREGELHVRTARVEPAEAVAEDADVLAYSSYVWNERYTLEVARLAKQEHAGAFVVFGGPSVPRRPERAAAFLREHPFVDALAFGEGEQTFRELLRALLDGKDLAQVRGAMLRGGLLTPPRERLADFDGEASPYLDGTFDGFRPTGAAVIETNRGCPFACTFCDWGQAINSRVHELPQARVLAEVEWIAQRRIPYLYIVDANFGMRRRDLDLVKAIGAIKARTGFPQYVFFHLTKNAQERHLSIVLALREAGIGTHLALSAQDFEERVLLAVKRDNIRLDRALELRRICHQRGIPTFNEMILGLPEQTYDSFADSMCKAVTPYPLDAFNLYLARLLENAEMASAAERARHGIESRLVQIASFHQRGPQVPVQEVEEVVVGTRTMPGADWRRAFKLGYFLAASHNLRVLDLVLQAARPRLRAFVESLLARLPPRIDAALERHAQAILDGRAMVLPAEGTGDHLWAAEDAVLVEVLRAPDEFYGWALSAARGDALLEEAVRFQAFLGPAPGEATFAYDFPAWRAQAHEGAPPLRETRFSWRPLLPAGDLSQLALAWLGAVHARAPAGYLIALPR
ncbi:MAG TPA: radical SAM protein [Myxococcales bacterium]|nr:radical SAM protein [Myxococcales bacterium]